MVVLLVFVPFVHNITHSFITSHRVWFDFFPQITAHTGFSMAALKLTNEAAVEALRFGSTFVIFLRSSLAAAVSVVRHLFDVQYQITICGIVPSIYLFINQAACHNSYCNACRGLGLFPLSQVNGQNRRGPAGARAPRCNVRVFFLFRHGLGEDGAPPPPPLFLMPADPVFCGVCLHVLIHSTDFMSILASGISMLCLI